MNTANGNGDTLNRRTTENTELKSLDGEHTEICLDDSENTSDEHAQMIRQHSPKSNKKRKCGFCGIEVRDIAREHFVHYFSLKN